MSTPSSSLPPADIYDGSTLHLSPSSPLLNFFPAVSVVNESSQQPGWTGWYPISTQDQVIYEWYADASPNPNDRQGGGWIVLPAVYNANSFQLLFDLPASASNEGWLVRVQVDSGDLKEVTSGDDIVVDGGAKGEPHSLRVQASCSNPRGGCGSSSDPFKFRGVDVMVTMAVVANSAKISSTSLDDASSLVSYQGYTTSHEAAALVPDEVIKQSMGGTLSWTTTKGATASIGFYGSSILVLGATGPSLSTYSAGILSSSHKSQTLSAKSPQTVPNQVIAFFSGMEDTNHILVLENLVEGGGLVIDGFWAWSAGKATFGQGPEQPAPASMTVGPPVSTSTEGIGFITQPTQGPLIPIGTSGPSSGTIVGAVVGCLFALAAVIFLFLWYRNKIKPNPETKKKFTNKWDEANALDRQDNSFVSVKAAPEVPGATYSMGPGNYAYPGAGDKKEGGMPKSPFHSTFA